MRAPHAAVGVRGDAVGMARIVGNACERFELEALADPRAQDVSIHGIDEVADGAIGGERGSVGDDEGNGESLACAVGREAVKIADGFFFGIVHRAEPERSVRMTAAVVDADRVVIDHVQQ